MTAPSLPMRARSSHLGCSSGLLSPFMLGDPAQNHKCQNVPSRNFIPSALFPFFKAPICDPCLRLGRPCAPPIRAIRSCPLLPVLSTRRLLRSSAALAPQMMSNRCRPESVEFLLFPCPSAPVPRSPPVAVSTPPRTVMNPGDSINRSAMWAPPPATSGRCPQAGAAPPRHPWGNQSADSSAGAATSAHPCASVLKGNGGGVCRIKA